MAGYVKIWTTIESDSWFLSLSNMSRGLWIQLIIAAKSGSETGQIWGKSWAQLAHRWGCDRSTCARTLRKFADAGKVTLEKDDNGTILITICNYLLWQGVKGPKEAVALSQKRGKPCEKSPKNQRPQNSSVQNSSEQNSKILSGKPDSPPPDSGNKKVGKPDLRFRIWFNSPAGQEYISKICQTIGWTMDGMQALSHDAELWLANPSNPKRHKKDWGRFWKNWVDKHIEIQSDRKRKAEKMTAEQERNRHASRR